MGIKCNDGMVFGRCVWHVCTIEDFGRGLGWGVHLCRILEVAWTEMLLQIGRTEKGWVVV